MITVAIANQKGGVGKTIAEHMRDVLLETDNAAVMWGDVRLLDDCAIRCAHTTLMEAHPLDRHKRILDALDHSCLFEKYYVKVDLWNGHGYAERHVRYFRLLDNLTKIG